MAVDNKFIMAGGFGKSYRELNCSSGVVGIASAIKSYQQNMDRILSLWEFPIHFYGLGRVTKEAFNQVAVYPEDIFTNTSYLASDDLEDEPIHVKANSGRGVILVKLGEASEQYNEMRDKFQFLLSPEDMANLDLGSDAILSSMIVGAWTAFETLAGDLWEAAIDFHPNVFLDAIASTDQRTKTRTVQLTMEIDEAKRKDLNFRTILTKLLKNNKNKQINFSTYDDLRRAYSDGFAVDFESFNAAKDRSLFNLSKIRNLIVHKGSIVDDEFLSTMVNVSAPLPQFANLEKNTRIPLDGSLVSFLIDGSIKSSIRLIYDIDKWLLGR